jgi:hypothetical protein
MGNKQSRKSDYALSYSRETAYLTAPSSREGTLLTGELEELLQRENLGGVADKLKLFAQNFENGLDVSDLANRSIDYLEGSGLTPLQRRRLIRAASGSVLTPEKTKKVGRKREGRSKGSRGKKHVLLKVQIWNFRFIIILKILGKI